MYSQNYSGKAIHMSVKFSCEFQKEKLNKIQKNAVSTWSIDPDLKY